MASPQSSFDFLLGRLPFNKNLLFSDACTSYGMAGVVLLDAAENRGSLMEGFFWQISWDEWKRAVSMSHLSPGSVKINPAEFMALIICETFAEFCSGKCLSQSISFRPWVGSIWLAVRFILLTVVRKARTCIY